MACDPVIQWARIVAATNEQDWSTVEALIAEGFTHVIVVGDLYSTTPTYQFDKAGIMAMNRSLAERGWQHHTKSAVTLGNTVVATAEDTFADGTSQLGYAMIRFNDQGQAVQMYATVPTE